MSPKEKTHTHHRASVLRERETGGGGWKGEAGNIKSQTKARAGVVVKACELSLNGRLVLRRDGNNNNNNNLFVNAIYSEAFSSIWRRIKGKRRWCRASATAVRYSPGLRNHG
jgi:hypothetical protein